MPEGYSVQQVCENGHMITGSFGRKPTAQQKYCKKCGEKTIIACPNCGKEIQCDRPAVKDDWGVASVRNVLPSYCPDCGEPYPWTPKKIITAIQILAEFGNLDDEEKKTIEQDVHNIAKDVPEAELSARRIKRIWDKGSRVGYEVIMEFASRTAANILKGP